MIFGSLMMFEDLPEGLRLNLSFIIPVVVAFALITTALLTLVFRTHRSKVTTGREGIVGEIGNTVEKVHDEGKVFVHGEYWDACSDVPIEKGRKVRVLEVAAGTKLKVEETDPTPSSS
jgi:membrane-bound serine protease (ClpP class)